MPAGDQEFVRTIRAKAQGSLTAPTKQYATFKDFWLEKPFLNPARANTHITSGYDYHMKVTLSPPLSRSILSPYSGPVSSPPHTSLTSPFPLLSSAGNHAVLGAGQSRLRRGPTRPRPRPHAAKEHPRLGPGTSPHSPLLLLLLLPSLYPLFLSIPAQE
jgi:hypothetical protein